jgi:hypothetical protein
MFCIQCGAENEDTAEFCIKCGARLEASAMPTSVSSGPAPTKPKSVERGVLPHDRKEAAVEKRYRALRIIGSFYKVLGAMVGTLTLLAVIGILVLSVAGGAALDNMSRDTGFTGLFSGVLGGLLLGVVATIYGGGLAVTLYAAGEGVYLLLALEENTRATVALLKRQVSPQPPVSSP